MPSNRIERTWKDRLVRMLPSGVGTSVTKPKHFRAMAGVRGQNFASGSNSMKYALGVARFENRSSAGRAYLAATASSFSMRTAVILYSGVLV